MRLVLAALLSYCISLASKLSFTLRFTGFNQKEKPKLSLCNAVFVADNRVAGPPVEVNWAASPSTLRSELVGDDVAESKVNAMPLGPESEYGGLASFNFQRARRLAASPDAAVSKRARTKPGRQHPTGDFKRDFKLQNWWI